MFRGVYIFISVLLVCARFYYCVWISELFLWSRMTNLYHSVNLYIILGPVSLCLS